MRTLTFPDGVVDVTAADAHSGPGDCYDRLHVNSSCVWARRDGGPWHRCEEARGWFRAAEEAAVFDTAADAWAWLVVGGPEDHPYTRHVRAS